MSDAHEKISLSSPQVVHLCRHVVEGMADLGQFIVPRLGCPGRGITRGVRPCGSRRAARGDAQDRG